MTEIAEALQKIAEAIQALCIVIALIGFANILCRRFES